MARTFKDLFGSNRKGITVQGAEREFIYDEEAMTKMHCLKKNKVVGCYSITIEVIKIASKAIQKDLRHVIPNIYLDGHIPDEWLMGNSVTLPKELNYTM